MFSGSLVALVTPFKDGEVCEETLRKLIEFHIEQGTHGIVPCGTTGESATLTHEEHERVIEITVEAVKKRVPVLAGTGSNSTEEAIRLTKHAKQIGADGALLISPYYNKPTQEGIYQHYKRVAEEAKFPIVPYNVPGRTGSNILPTTVARMAEIPNVVAIKEASGSLQQVSDIIGLSGDKIAVLSGDDFVTFPMLAVGAKGVISVTANLAPADVATMCDAFAAGDIKRAQELHYKLRPLADACFLETNPIPTKSALAMMGMIAPEIRLPMTMISKANEPKLREALKAYGLLT